MVENCLIKKRRTNEFDCDRYRMIGHKHGEDIGLTVRDRRKEKDSRRERTKEPLCRCQKVVADTSISERKIPVSPFQDFAFKINKEALILRIRKFTSK